MRREVHNHHLQLHRLTAICLRTEHFRKGPTTGNCGRTIPLRFPGLLKTGKRRSHLLTREQHARSVGFRQNRFPIESGETYVLTFQVSSDSSREIQSFVQLDGSPWTMYSTDNLYIITNNMTEYTYTFTMYNPTDNASDLEFFIGGPGAGTTYIDNVVLKKISPEPAQQNYPSVKPVMDRSNIIIYELVPGSYNGGSWDGGYCLKGITGKLDKIKELGVNCIWLTPIFQGEGMGYWTYDFYKISTKLGTLNDIKEFVYEAHKRNIMVILDLAFNHTWTQHPFFQDVLKNKGLSPYRDYYIWSGEPGKLNFQLLLRLDQSAESQSDKPDGKGIRIRRGGILADQSGH